MDEKKLKLVNKLSLALGIAFMPPIWAVLSPYFGVTCGAVALVCAAVYVANGNKIADAVRIIVGFLLGDIWAYAALRIMSAISWNPDITMYITLFVLGAAAVLIAESVPKIIFLPSWLCGWALGLCIMAPVGHESVGTLPIEIGVSMIAGVVWVGIGVDLFQKLIVRLVMKK